MKVVFIIKENVLFLLHVVKNGSIVENVMMKNKNVLKNIWCLKMLKK
jgi:hypothetical protein